MLGRPLSMYFLCSFSSILTLLPFRSLNHFYFFLLCTWFLGNNRFPKHCVELLVLLMEHHLISVCIYFFSKFPSLQCIPSGNSIFFSLFFLSFHIRSLGKNQNGEKNNNATATTIWKTME